MSENTGYALRFISGKYQGNEYPLKKNKEVIIGRGSDIDITLVEDMISRRHAKIVLGDDYIILEDMGSTNGCFVNGERVKKARLREGDRILLGTSIIKLVAYESEGLDNQAQPARPAPPPPLSISGGGRPAMGATMNLTAFQPDAAMFTPPAKPAPPKMPPFGSPSSDQMVAPPPKPPSLAAPPPLFGSPAASPPPVAPASTNFDSFSPPPPRPAPQAPPRPASNAYASTGPLPLLPPPQGPVIMDGTLDEMPLADLFEMFVNSQRNGVLVIRAEIDGHLHFRNGRIVYATLQSHTPLSAKKAAFTILGWKNGDYALYPPDELAIRERIDEDPLELLKRAKRQSDDLRRYKAEMPPNVQNFQLVIPLDAPLRALKPDMLDTFQLVLSYGSLESVLQLSTHTEVDTYQHLLHLLKQQYIQAL